MGGFTQIFLFLAFNLSLVLNNDKEITSKIAKIMPLIKIQTSAPIAASDAQVNDLLKSLSAKLAKHVNKPESYVMTSFEPQARMTFGGTFEPVCYLEIKNIGTMSPAQTKAMSKDFCELIQMTLGVPQNRIYIEFNDAKGSMWGWNGSTF